MNAYIVQAFIVLDLHLRSKFHLDGENIVTFIPVHHRTILRYFIVHQMAHLGQHFQGLVIRIMVIPVAGKNIVIRRHAFEKANRDIVGAAMMWDHQQINVHRRSDLQRLDIARIGEQPLREPWLNGSS